MGKAFNLQNYTFDERTGRWVYNSNFDQVRNKVTLQKLYEATGKRYVPPQKIVRKAPVSVRRRAPMPKRYQKLFIAGTKFASGNGTVDRTFRPMTLRGGKNPNYNWARVQYSSFDGGKPGKTGANSYWGAKVDKGKSAAKGGICTLRGIKEWIRHLEIAHHAMAIQATNFRIVVTRRALKIFQNSFKYQQFYSNGAQRWHPLAPATLKRRTKRGTGNHILKEYGDLYKSIKIEENSGLNQSRVYTDIVPANTAHHKKYSFCYAGYHNEGVGTYGAAWNGYNTKSYIKRQFIGHSSHLNFRTDGFIRKMMKQYLFDSVFLIRR